MLVARGLMGRLFCCFFLRRLVSQDVAVLHNVSIVADRREACESSHR